jgi:hypothetical protein
MKHHYSTLAVAALVAGFSGVSLAAEQAPVQLPDLGSQQQVQVRGSQLMTTEERQAFRARMQAAGSAEERQTIRAEQHELMQKRAAEKGLKLPDAPASGFGYGQGRGMGMGRGMGGNR